MLSIGRKGESTNEMIWVDRSESLSFVLPEYNQLEVVGRSRLPKDKLCHAVDGVIRPTMSQWRMVQQEVVQIWTGLERYFQWIGSRDMDSICGVTRRACPRSGKWLLRMWIEVG